MKLTPEGLDLIKSHEGLRLHAYPDPGTNGAPYTIGYGHTSLAGAPVVTKGMTITEQEAERILARDLDKFADIVRKEVKVDLTDNQFSALVSFVYNVGPANFKKSSVLKAVNQKRFDLVPARLALFNKANGRVLKGLVKRRAEEAKLFSQGYEHDDEFVTGAEPVQGKSALASTTNIAASLSGVAAVTSAASQIATDIDTIGVPTHWLVIALAVGTVLASAWIIYQRIKKSKEEGV